MSWDIYGEKLERGHCEVHPWVGEEYPCTICINTQENNRKQEEAYRQHELEWYKAIEEEQRHLYLIENDDEYKILSETEENLLKQLSIIKEKKEEIIKNSPI